MCSFCYPPASKASREVANITKRKNMHTPVFSGAKISNISLSLPLNFIFVHLSRVASSFRHLKSITMLLPILPHPASLQKIYSEVFPNCSHLGTTQKWRHAASLDDFWPLRWPSGLRLQVPKFWKKKKVFWPHSPLCHAFINTLGLCPWNALPLPFMCDVIYDWSLTSRKNVTDPK